MKKLGPTQVHALAMLYNDPIEPGMHYFVNVRAATLRRLREAGLVDFVGVRRPRWELTKTGRERVRELLKQSKITRRERDE